MADTECKVRQIRIRRSLPCDQAVIIQCPIVIRSILRVKDTRLIRQKGPHLPFVLLLFRRDPGDRDSLPFWDVAMGTGAVMLWVGFWAGA